MALLQHCFSFKGRISNRTFRRHLFCVVIFLVMSYIPLTLFCALKPLIICVKWKRTMPVEGMSSINLNTIIKKSEDLVDINRLISKECISQEYVAVVQSLSL